MARIDEKRCRRRAARFEADRQRGVCVAAEQRTSGPNATVAVGVHGVDRNGMEPSARRMVVEPRDAADSALPRSQRIDAAKHEGLRVVGRLEVLQGPNCRTVADCRGYEER